MLLSYITVCHFLLLFVVMDLSPKFSRRVRDSERFSNNLVSILVPDNFFCLYLKVITMHVIVKCFSIYFQRVPHVFCVKYADRIPATVKVVVRTGYCIWVDFDKVNEQFIGLRAFYKDFSIQGGHTLLFEFCGDFEFKVCIVDLYGSEIEYPVIVHHLQKCEPRNGMYFLQFLLIEMDI